MREHYPLRRNLRQFSSAEMLNRSLQQRNNCKRRRNILDLEGVVLKSTFFLYVFLFCIQISQGNQNSIVYVKGVTDEQARLHCQSNHRNDGDTPVLVLWYKNRARIPFFTLDLRDGGATQFVEDSMQGRISSDHQGDWLTIKKLQVTDSGHYKCKVDYENSPTLAAMLNLTVYQPPTDLVIQDSSQRNITGPVYGPLNQDAPLKLYCIATGGIPPPVVNWWNGSSKISSDSSYSRPKLLTSHERGLYRKRRYSRFVRSHHGALSMAYRQLQSTKVVEELYIESIDRDLFGANLSCKAKNNDISQSLVRSVRIDIYLRPSHVNIYGPSTALVEGSKTRLKCESTGSHPAAKIIWERNRSSPEILQGDNTELQNSISDTKTISWLNFSPTVEDHGTTVTCTAKNAFLPGSGMSKSTTLDVHFAPRVNLTLGKSIEGDAIKEGEDVYFECSCNSNPKEETITWFRNGEAMKHSIKDGIIIISRNLALQKVHRSFAGNYTCSASNNLGTTESNIVQLLVMFLPVCASEQSTVAVSQDEMIRLPCHVTARPANRIKFTWAFNNTLDTIQVDEDKIESHGLTSYLHYKPLIARDYGMLSCWATNEVGRQLEPCIFTVVEAGPPGQVTNCILENQTVSDLEVLCYPGPDGGSRQRFVASVFDSLTNSMATRLENVEEPKFHIGDLAPGKDYFIVISAQNDKGLSEPLRMEVARMKVAEKRMVNVNTTPVSPLVGVFIGLVGGFALLLMVALIFSKARNNKSSCWRPDSVSSCQINDIAKDKENLQLPQNNCRMDQKNGDRGRRSLEGEEEEDSPDLVKSSNETSQLLTTHSCNELPPKRNAYGITGPVPIAPLSPIANTTRLESPSSRRSYLESLQRHLTAEESFV